MDFLPRELWLEVFDFLRGPAHDPSFPHFQAIPVKDIKNLLLVSRRFNQLAEPAIYESFTLNSRNAIKTDQSAGIMQRLYAKPIRMTWVKYLFVDLWTERSTDFPSHKVSELLPRLTELRGLRMVYFRGQSEIVPVVCSLNSLQHLYIDRVNLSGGPTSPVQGNISSIQGLANLQSLSLYNRQTADSPFHLIALLPNITELRLSIPNAEILWSITNQAQATPYRFDKLRIFESYEPLQPRLFEQLYSFLGLCPKLRVLSLNPSTAIQSPTPEPLLPFPSTSIPLLESFTGSLKVAEAIIPGRPVHEIHILLAPKDWRHITEEHLETLGSGTVPVRHLHLETYLWLKDWLKSVSGTFGAVEEFDLRFWADHFGTVAKYPMDELKHFQKLRRLRIRKGAGSAFTGDTQSIPVSEPESVQRKFLQDLDKSGLYPLLEEVEISGRNEWVKQEGQWIHRV
ncbi:hypothetical protein FRC01_007443 [Tulasnella sp. 417]|nr:hypothetical protein FRC01_007443 [Tulasnella sp. 417]